MSKTLEMAIIGAQVALEVDSNDAEHDALYDLVETLTYKHGFVGFPKIARLSREVIVTEKIDGTNGVIYIDDDGTFLIGSRSRWLDAKTDNHGFHRWATEHEQELRKLGPGRHFGEWWGSGIQRGYGLPKGEKRFSLFNTGRWMDTHSPNVREPDIRQLGDKQEWAPPCCHVVPILWQGLFALRPINECIRKLRYRGSIASPGFMKPEGVVVYHTAANTYFKKTLEKDESPKTNSQEIDSLVGW